ncbi:hypothetical protein F0U44_20920 [Nocardioides humilatus]|uniref:Uncharacterized protein n=1 Tax=Nocardioides humilatus TaxID=2607660 RepID=A0A5B1L471_9ACTN|nr:type VI secretion system tube protein Hcp [Nocardioides humilatus]KAA1415453.1 hypothetical protein F0U44_20920 [Nocardioides humilatus]
MTAVPRRQSLPLLVLILTIVASAWWIARPASEAAPLPTQSAPPQPTVSGAGNISFSLSPSLTVPITSFQFGGGRAVSSMGEISNLSLSEATVTIESSLTDPRLLEALGSGDSISTVTVTSPDASNGRRKWVMTDVIISSASWARGLKDGSMSVSLNFGTITLTTYGRAGNVISSYCAINRNNSDCNVT